MLPKTVAVQGVYQLLKNSPAIQAQVDNRIYARHAPPKAGFPYILVSYNWGGDDNRSQARGLDIYVEVCCVAKTAIDADDVMGLVDGVVRQVPELPHGWVAWSPITATPIQFEKEIELEQKRIYTTGAQYRVRATKRD